MPPHFPYPTPLDDCVAVYREVVSRHAPERVVVHGNSAGGNLAAALILRAKAEGLPLPGGLILETPELDLTESGDSFATNAIIDVVLQRSLGEANRLYAAGHDLADPFVSPLFGDVPGWPRTLLTAGTRDIMKKISFEQGGAEYDKRSRYGIPTSIVITTTGGKKLDTGLIMYPAGHARNNTANLRDFLTHKF